MSNFVSTLVIILILSYSSFAGSLVMVQAPPRYAPPSGEGYKAVAAVNSGGYSFAAIKSDNTLATWGDNPNGELNPPSGQFKAIDGFGFFAGIRTDGSLAQWGGSYNLAQVPAGNDFVEVAAGLYNGYALHTNGTISGWGDLNVAAPEGIFKNIDSDGFGLLAIRQDGSLFLPSGAFVPSGNDFIDISAGSGGNYLALRSNGSLAAWTTNGQTPVPAGTFKAIESGDGSYFAIRTDGSLVAWGYYWDTHPQLTLPAGTFSAVATPGTTIAVALTPEPATISLVAMGLLVLRKKSRNSHFSFPE